LEVVMLVVVRLVVVTPTHILYHASLIAHYTCWIFFIISFVSFHHVVSGHCDHVREAKSHTHLFDAGWQIVREGRPQPFEDHRAENLHGTHTFEGRLIGTGDFRKHNADAIHVDLVRVKLQFGAASDSNGPSVLLDQFRGHIVHYTKHVVVNRSIVGKVGRKVKRSTGERRERQKKTACRRTAGRKGKMKDGRTKESMDRTNEITDGWNDHRTNEQKTEEQTNGKDERKKRKTGRTEGQTEGRKTRRNGQTEGRTKWKKGRTGEMEEQTGARKGRRNRKVRGEGERTKGKAG